MVVLTRSQSRQKNLERALSSSSSEKSLGRGVGAKGKDGSEVDRPEHLPNNRNEPNSSKAAAPVVAPKRRSLHDLLMEGNNLSQGGERLGRGCRIQRETQSLDEEYLRSSFGEDSEWNGRRNGALSEPFTIHRRYPERESTKAQILEDFDASSVESSEGRRGNRARGAYHFRHHPELARGLSREPRRASSSSSSSLSSAGEEGGPALSPSARWAKRGRSPDADSAPSGSSLRDASVARLAEADARAGDFARASPSLPSADDFSSADEDAAMTAAEVRRAVRRAKAAGARNDRLARAMAEAGLDAPAKGGEKGPERAPDEASHRARRRRLDRRYRHLLARGEREREGEGEAGERAVGGGPAREEELAPLRIDGGVSFASVGGLPGHVVVLREAVLFPLMYPRLFRARGLGAAPRGVLFVGPPGTGKTLMARALAAEAARASARPIAFFLRKGADILSKWVGESERQLGLLFAEARRRRPSIIFFDELDGLAPVRQGRSEQAQAALVATLLALMDGMEDRHRAAPAGRKRAKRTPPNAAKNDDDDDDDDLGGVVVIGATNRPEMLDPALRRPGRFDRELLFPLPDTAARRHILEILTAAPRAAKEGKGDVKEAERGGNEVGMDGELLAELAELTAGYSGADLQALCTEARLNALRRGLPELYLTSARLRIPAARAARGRLSRDDFLAAALRLQPSQRRAGEGGVGGWHPRAELAAAAHLEPLFRGLREALLRGLAGVCPGVRAALARARRDCADLREALREMAAFPIPHKRHAVVVFLELAGGARGEKGRPAGAASRATLANAAAAVMRGLPGLRGFTAAMPLLRVGLAEGPGEGFGGPGEGFGGPGGHFAGLVRAVRGAGPSCVLLTGLEAWLRELGAEPGERGRRLHALRYLLGLLADCEAVVLIPTVDGAARRALLDDAPDENDNADAQKDDEDDENEDENEEEEGGEGGPVRLRKLACAGLPPPLQVCRATLRAGPGRAPLRGFLAHLRRVVGLALRGAADSGKDAPDREDDGGESGKDAWEADPWPPRRKARGGGAARRAAVARWRRVEYRRLQLRHVLLRWLGQHLAAGRFRLFLSADLDLDPAHARFAAWRRATAGRGRIGLRAVLAKLEAGAYVCLSQYHDDIDRIVRNVRGFFRSRGLLDQKYRLKALELRETTILNMYKINRNLVRFCEAHRDVEEPPPLSDEEDEDEKEEEEDDDDEKDDEDKTEEEEEEEEGEDGVGRANPSRGGTVHAPASGGNENRGGGNYPQRAHRKLRIFGRRRRRRRRPVGVGNASDKKNPKEKEEAEAEKGKSDEKQEEGVAVGDVALPQPALLEEGCGDAAQRALSVCSSPSKEEHEKNGNANSEKEEKGNGNDEKENRDEERSSPLSMLSSPTSPFSSTEVLFAAEALVVGLSFAELDDVFWSVMRQLQEMENEASPAAPSKAKIDNNNEKEKVGGRLERMEGFAHEEEETRKGKEGFKEKWISDGEVDHFFLHSLKVAVTEIRGGECGGRGGGERECIGETLDRTTTENALLVHDKAIR